MRKRTLAMVALTLLAGALAIAWFMTPQLAEPFRSFEENIASLRQEGWRLAQAPDLPGPYRRFGHSFQTAIGSDGAITNRKGAIVVTHQFIAIPGIEQLSVCLETEDGRLTIVVLER